VKLKPEKISHDLCNNDVTMDVNILYAILLNQSDANAKMGKVYNGNTCMVFITTFLIYS